MVLLTFENIGSATRYLETDNIVELTPANFSQLMKDDAIWVVDFYTASCIKCKTLVPEYQKLAKALKGLVKVGTVNLTQHRQLAHPNGVRSVPKIKIFSVNKHHPFDYSGDLDALEIAEEVLYEIKKKVVLSIVKGSSRRKLSGSYKYKRIYK